MNNGNASFHRQNGWILCRDPRLSRLLETELAYLGISAEISPTLPSPSENICILVADGDVFDAEACLSLATACGCPLLIFGRASLPLPADRASTAFLRRPFALTGFEKAIRALLPASPGAATLAAVAEDAEISAPTAASPKLPPLTAQDGTVTVGDHTVTLTPAEWAILEYLRTRPGETVTRDELASLLGGGGNIVDVYVCRLRAKIEKPLGRRMIRTVRGVGYVMEI